MIQQKVVSGTKLYVSLSMPTETEIMRKFAVYYAVGIIIAAVVFRIVRAWLKSRRDSGDQSL
ncbi:MAG: hypothetical protein IIA59_06650 [Candidatus Marinimicrobia bacterium]|nr:hypothetical protein [Candidatus Neomarinimicrobiota bacterium]